MQTQTFLSGGLNGFDAAVMSLVQQHFHNPAADAIFPVITYLGEAGIFWIALSLALLISRKARRPGFLMLCAIALGFLIGEVTIKNIVCRPRPFQAFPDLTSLLISPPSGFSFPSGHSCASFAAAVTLFLWKKKWGAPALILACLIAFSRVFLFVHWPTDVLAGILLGICSALLIHWLVCPRLDSLRWFRSADSLE